MSYTISQLVRIHARSKLELQEVAYMAQQVMAMVDFAQKTTTYMLVEPERGFLTPTGEFSTDPYEARLFWHWSEKYAGRTMLKKFGWEPEVTGMFLPTNKALMHRATYLIGRAGMHKETMRNAKIGIAMITVKRTLLVGFAATAILAAVRYFWG